jgi:hypothetical protein
VENASSSVTAPYGSLEGYWRPYLSLASRLAPGLQARDSALLLASFAAESEFAPLLSRGATAVPPAELAEQLRACAADGRADLLLVEFDHSRAPADADRRAFAEDGMTDR